MKHFNLLAIGILSLLLVGCSYNANEATSAVSSQMASDDIVTPSTAEHKLSLCVPSSEQGMYTVDSIANGYGNIFYIVILILRQCSRYLYAIHQIVHTQMIAALPGCKLMKAVFSPEFYNLGIQFFLCKTASHQTTLLAFGLLMRTEKTRNCYSVPKADRASALLFIQMKQIRHCILFCQRYPNRRAG